MDSQQQPLSKDDGFMLIEVSKLDDPARPMRTDLTAESVEDLVLSIRQMGIIEPLIVRAKGDRYEVIAGHRRLMASQIAKLEQVPCIVKTLGQEETEIMKIHENLYREEISPLDEAKHFDYLIQQLKLSPAKVAQLVGRSPSYVSDRLAIFNYPNELRQALVEKKIAFSTAREFNRHPDKQKVKEFVRYAVSNGITPNLARQWVIDDMKSRDPQQQTSTPSSDGYTSEESERPFYHCPLCAQAIDAPELTVVYMHDKCHKEFTSALNSTPNSEPTPTA